MRTEIMPANCLLATRSSRWRALRFREGWCAYRNKMSALIRERRDTQLRWHQSLYKAATDYAFARVLCLLPGC